MMDRHAELPARWLGRRGFGISILQEESVSKVINSFILNLFQDLNALYIRSRNEFGMT